MNVPFQPPLTAKVVLVEVTLPDLNDTATELVVDVLLARKGGARGCT